jgi:hypothetical protein
MVAAVVPSATSSAASISVISSTLLTNAAPELRAPLEDLQSKPLLELIPWQQRSLCLDQNQHPVETIQPIDSIRPVGPTTYTTPLSLGPGKNTSDDPGMIVFSAV